MLLREVEVRYSTTRRVDAPRTIRSAEDVFQVCRDMADATQERFCALLLDARHRVLARQTVAVGTLSSVEVHPRDVFRAAIISGAAAVILIHNHPSGDPAPSADDLALTRRLAEVGRLVGIRVLDHVVIGDGNYESLAESCAIS